MSELLFVAVLFTVFFVSALSSYKESLGKYRRKSFLANKPATIRNLQSNINVEVDKDNPCDSPLFEQAKKALVECGFSAKESKDMLNKSYKSSFDKVEEWVKNAIIEANKV